MQHIRHVQIGNLKRAIKKHAVKHVPPESPPPVDGSPVAFVWGALFVVIVIFLLAEFSSRISHERTELKQKLKEDEKEKREREHWRQKKEEEARIKLKEKKLHKLKIKQRELAEIEYKKMRSAEEANKDSLRDFL